MKSLVQRVREDGVQPNPEAKVSKRDLAISLVSRFKPGIVEMLRAPVPGKARHKTPDKTDVVRIALTGGPCGGKSSALNELAKKATAAGFDIFVAPEVATVLFNTGVQFTPGETFQEVFQGGTLALQLQLERTLTNIAASTGRPTILILDRGMMDSKGYCTPEVWKRILASMNENEANADISESYMLQRYDAIIHLCTAAKGAQTHYKHGWTTDDMGHKVFRRESPEEAKQADDRMLQCWAAHTNHVVLDNTADFQDKIEKACDAILKVALAKHPQGSKVAI